MICGLVGTAALATVTSCWAAPQIVAGITNIAAAANGGLIVAYSSQVLDENGQIMPEWQVTHLIDGKCVLGNYIPSDSYGWSSQNLPSLEAPEWVVFTFAGNATADKFAAAHNSSGPCRAGVDYTKVLAATIAAYAQQAGTRE